MTERRTDSVKKLSQRLHWNAKGHSAQLHPSGPFTPSFTLYSVPSRPQWRFSPRPDAPRFLIRTANIRACQPSVTRTRSLKHPRERPKGERRMGRARRRKNQPRPSGDEAEALRDAASVRRRLWKYYARLNLTLYRVERWTKTFYKDLLTI